MGSGSPKEGHSSPILTIVNHPGLLEFIVIDSLEGYNSKRKNKEQQFGDTFSVKFLSISNYCCS